MHEVITGGRDMAEYGLKYVANFDSRKEAGAKAFTLEIWQKDLPQSFEAKTIRAWRGLTLEVDGDDDPVSPIQKTIVNFTLVDAPEIADAATEKSGDWQEFFTPDSTMYKVIIKQGQQFLWSGFITPDNWQESLDYRGAVTITARDNIGHLQDFDFDLQGDNAGTATIANLLKAAIDKIDFQMAIYYLLGEWEYQSAHKWILYDNSELADFRVNVSQFEGKNWYDVVESVLSSLGLFIRYTGNNQYVVSHLRYLPWLGNPTQQSTDVQDVVFLGGGTRTYKPAYKRIVENMKYDFSEEAKFDIMEGLSPDNNILQYTYESKYDNPNGINITETDTGYYALNKGGNTAGWQYGAGFLNAEKLEVIDRYSTEILLDKASTALIVANNTEQSKLARTYKFANVAKPSGIIRLTFDSNCYLTIKNKSITSCPSHLSRLTWALRYEVAGKSYYLNKNLHGYKWGDNVQILTYADMAEDSIDLDFSVDLNDQNIQGGGDIYLLIDSVTFQHSVFYFPYETDPNTTETINTTTGIYMGVRGLALVVSGETTLVSDTITTINNEKYNVTARISPDIGFLSRKVGWQTPQNYGNAVYYTNSDGLVAPVLYRVTWDGVTSPFPVFLHKQILQYHREPMQMLEGDCMPSPAGLWNYNAITRYKGHKFLLQGGTYDFVSGIMSGVRLHEFEQYDDIWSEDAPEVGGVWSVTLTEVGPNKILVVRALIDSAGIALKDAKTMADNPPAMVGNNYTHAEAQSIQKAIAAAGGTATIAEVTTN